MVEEDLKDVYLNSKFKIQHLSYVAVTGKLKQRRRLEFSSGNSYNLTSASVGIRPAAYFFAELGRLAK